MKICQKHVVVKAKGVRIVNLLSTEKMLLPLGTCEKNEKNQKNLEFFGRVTMAELSISLGTCDKSRL